MPSEAGHAGGLDAEVRERMLAGWTLAARNSDAARFTRRAGASAGWGIGWLLLALIGGVIWLPLAGLGVVCLLIWLIRAVAAGEDALVVTIDRQGALRRSLNGHDVHPPSESLSFTPLFAWLRGTTREQRECSRCGIANPANAASCQWCRKPLGISTST